MAHVTFRFTDIEGSLGPIIVPVQSFFERRNVRRRYHCTSDNA